MRWPFSRCLPVEKVGARCANGGTVNSLYAAVKHVAQFGLKRCICETVTDNITKLRRQNAVAFFQAWAQERMAAGVPAKGLEQAFAAEIAVSPSMWSQIKSSRPISDKLARQIEHHVGRPSGWMDQQHEGTEAPNEAEQHFLDVARAAWRASNAKGKRELLKMVRNTVAVGSPTE